MARVSLTQALAQEIIKIVFDRWYKQLGLAECLEIIEIFQKLQNKQDNSNQATTHTWDSGNSKRLCEGA